MKQKHFIKIGMQSIGFLVLVVVFGLTCFRASPAAAGREQLPAVLSPSQDGRLETSDLASFTDTLINRQLADYHIAGASVSIVQDGQIKLAKGYGYSDVAQQVPVSPSESVFRIGSTSKLLTWTAVMQLAEQGKIDLDADVNTYLPDFQIPATFPAPITMLDLLGHTAGFEERSIGTESSTPEGMLTLHDYLARYMPDRVRPAGELISYSNYGAALAGYIVEAVSGMPFEEYIEANIFKPLSMDHSTFLQPSQPGLEGHLASAYSYNGEFIPGDLAYVNLLPAAAMSSTATDMANFMIAHLQQGKFEGRQVLKAETVQQMHSRLFSNDYRLDGMAYGFFEWSYDGQRMLWHSGDIGNWHSGLAIIPGQNAGFFVVYNSLEGFPAVAEFYYAFMDKFYPSQAPAGTLPVANSSQAVDGLSGEYRSTRSIYNHVERIISFPGAGNVRVRVNPDQTLSISSQSFHQIAPLVYATSGGTDTIIFRQDSQGKTSNFFVNSNQVFSYEKLSWYETSPFNLLALSVCYILLLSAVSAAFIWIFRRRKNNTPGSRIPVVARFWAFILSLAFLLLPVLTAIYFTQEYKSPFPYYMEVVLALILAASILVIGPVAFTFLAWIRGYWSRAGRIHYTLVTAALLGMVWLVYYWRLLGFRF